MVTREQIENSLDARSYQESIRLLRLFILGGIILLPIVALLLGLVAQDFIFSFLLVGSMGGLYILSMLGIFLYQTVQYKRLFEKISHYETHTVIFNRPCTPFGRYQVIPYIVKFKLTSGQYIQRETRKLFLIAGKNPPQAADYTNKSVQIAYNPTTKQLVILGLTPEQTENA